jgi:hypothetical protein
MKNDLLVPLGTATFGAVDPVQGVQTRVEGLEGIVLDMITVEPAESTLIEDPMATTDPAAPPSPEQEMEHVMAVSLNRLGWTKVRVRVCCHTGAASVRRSALRA